MKLERWEKPVDGPASWVPYSTQLVYELDISQTEDVFQTSI